MRIAIPVSKGKLAAHFDQCARFALIDADLIEVRTGASAQTPEALVVPYIEGAPYIGDNLCDQRT